jgi:hypothetical protein
MSAAVLAFVATTAPQGPNSDEVSPGLAGFLTVFLLALATVLLVRSMVKHLRKVRYGPGPDGYGPTDPARQAAAPRDAAPQDAAPQDAAPQDPSRSDPPG